MIIYLENNNQISGSDMLSAILRYDLVPVPVTLEMTAKATDELKAQLATGKILTLANGTHLEIIKAEQVNSNVIKEGKRLGAIFVIAVLAGCEPLLRVTKRAVIQNNTSMAEIYRSLGAKVRFDTDVKINNFVCLKGQMPTTRIALALQKEAAVIVYDFDKKALTVRRIQDLLNQPNPKIYDPAQVQWLENPTLEVRQNVNFLSVGQDGSEILGQAGDGSKIEYYPRADNRELLNLKRILVTRGVIIRQLDDDLMAGKAVSVDNKQFVVLTSAYRVDTGALGGSAVTATKAWLANMVDV